jgi:ribonuclease HI
MPWVRAKLREQLVYAKADESGRLVENGGRVEIRYKPKDGRLYHAGVKNLAVVDGAVLPEETCDPAAEAPPAKPAAGARASGGSRTASRASSAAAHVETPPRDGETVVYTDGACTGNPGPAGLGVVVLGREARTELSEYLGHGTNNIAELTAILRGLELTDGPVVIHTDSKYAIGVLTKGWKAKANTELILQIRAALAKRGQVRIVYVPGHSGIPLNERADELARRAISSRHTRTERV